MITASTFAFSLWIRRGASVFAIALTTLGIGVGNAAFAGKVEIFDVPGAVGTDPAVINNSQWIAGSYAGETGEYGFLRDPSGNFTTIDVASPICDSTTVTGLNNFNAVVGVAPDDNCSLRGFLRAPDGTITTIQGPDAFSTTAMDINDGGVICGFYDVLVSGVNDTTYGFIRAADGTMTSFSVPHSERTSAVAINSKGAITGFYDDRHLKTRGFIRSPKGKFKTVDVPTALETLPESINDSGDVSGDYQTADGNFGFIRKSDGTMILVDPNGSTSVNLPSIDNKGVATGFYDHSAFVRKRDGTITLLKVKDAAFAGAVSINAHGSATGGATINGENHGFLYQPRQR